MLKKIDKFRFLFTQSNVDVICGLKRGLYMIYVIRLLFVKALMFIGPIVLVMQKVLLYM